MVWCCPLFPSSVFCCWSAAKISDLATKPVPVKKGATNPTLRYLTYMFGASAPFMRTTVVEVLPQFILSNERNISLWIREEPFVPGALGSSRSRIVAYLQILPKTAMEYHPQSSKVVIQISGSPIVEDYFQKVIRPLMKSFSTYSFQATNINQ